MDFWIIEEKDGISDSHQSSNPFIQQSIFARSRSPMQRHDVENVASAGAMVAVRKHLPRAPAFAR
jgi:hypothetical protein